MLFIIFYISFAIKTLNEFLERNFFAMVMDKDSKQKNNCMPYNKPRFIKPVL